MSTDHRHAEPVLDAIGRICTTGCIALAIGGLIYGSWVLGLVAAVLLAGAITCAWVLERPRR